MAFKKTAIVIALFLIPHIAAIANSAKLLESSGIKGGVVVHLGCGDGTNTLKLRLNDNFIVQGLETNEEIIQKARNNISQSSPNGKVYVRRFDGVHLPYVQNLVNVIIIDNMFDVTKDEILRVLVPLGVAYYNGQKIVKPWPREIDEWHHFLHDADNNAVARDDIIDTPRSIQWIAPPRWGRSHEELASMSAAVTARGRIFFIVDKAPLDSIRYTGQWQLVARDAFNGSLLWTKDIDKWNDHLRHFRSGPVHLPRRLVAVGDKVYVTLGIDAPVAAIDAATGKVLNVYDKTERTEEILESDGILYLAVGTSEVFRQGEGLFERNEPKATDFRYIAAIDAASGELLWKADCPDDEYILPLTLTVKGQNVYYQSTSGIIRLDAGTGKPAWKKPRKTPMLRMSFASPTVVATEQVLLCADRVATADNTSDGIVKWGVHGWNEKGFPRKAKSVLTAYSVKDGTELWNVDCSEDYNSAVDIFVVGNMVWVGSNYKGYDLKTGKLVKELEWKGPPVGMAHHRCYRNKATENFIFTGRSGIEVVSLKDGWQINNSWVRGTCQYGIMPANGLLYAPPDACACFGKVKVAGFIALAPQRNKDALNPFTGDPVMEKGPAWNSKKTLTSNINDWPMYRNDITRSGRVSTTIPSKVNKLWSANLGGTLTQPVIADQKVFVAASSNHSVNALNVDNGELIWSYTLCAGVDSSPTFYKGLVIFGCRDGWVYALSASDGQLAWRFRAAPDDRQVCILDQLESIWPVHGSVLVQNDTLYVTAGRSTYLDGGIVLYRLDPLTAKVITKNVIYDQDPITGQQTGVEPLRRFDMEGSLSDILSGDGESVFMKHLHFDESGKPDKEEKPHLFCVTGFLGEEWFVRSYWLIGTDVGTGWGSWADSANIVPFGRILCFNDDRIYGYGRKEIQSGAVGHKLDAYHLFSKKKIMTSTVPGSRKKGDNKKTQIQPVQPAGTWSNDKSLTVRAMVLASDKLVVAGTPDPGVKMLGFLAFKNEAETLAALKGEKGVYLQVISASDGIKLSESKLDAIPVFDGISAANGKIFVALKNGSVQCWGQ